MCGFGIGSSLDGRRRARYSASAHAAATSSGERVNHLRVHHSARTGSELLGVSACGAAASYLTGNRRVPRDRGTG